MAVTTSDDEYVPLSDNNISDEEYVPSSKPKRSNKSKPKRKRKRKRRVIIDDDEKEDDDLNIHCNENNKPLQRRKKKAPSPPKQPLIEPEIVSKPDTVSNKKRSREEFENELIEKQASAHFFRSIEEEAQDIEKYEMEMVEMADIVEMEYKQKNNTKQSQRCQEPQCESLTICPMYFKHFGVSVCRECKWKTKYKCLSKTNAKKQYLLSEGDINSLKCWIKEIKRSENNEGDNRWMPKYMKLFLKYELEELSIEKWGSLEGIEGERNRREINRMQRSISNARKKRKVQFECLDDIEINKKVVEEHEAKTHVHTFGESECIDQETDEWRKICVDCGYVETWEEF